MPWQMEQIPRLQWSIAPRGEELPLGFARFEAQGHFRRTFIGCQCHRVNLFAQKLRF